MNSLTQITYNCCHGSGIAHIFVSMYLYNRFIFFKTHFPEACMRTHKGLSVSKVEQLIAQIIKSAPFQAGGDKHQVHYFYPDSSTILMPGDDHVLF